MFIRKKERGDHSSGSYDSTYAYYDRNRNVGRDFMAGMKTLVGGKIVGYTEMLNEARQIAYGTAVKYK